MRNDIENLADPISNQLLAALPQADVARIAPHLVLVDLSHGQVLYEPRGSLRYVHFPITSIVSLLAVTQESTPTEIAIVGNEGVVGVAVFMGADTSEARAVVQSAGQAYRLDARILKEEFRRGGALQRLLLRYTQALMTQISQTAVCEICVIPSSSNCAAGFCSVSTVCRRMGYRSEKK